MVKKLAVKWQVWDLFNLPLFGVYLIIGTMFRAGLLSPNPVYSTNLLSYPQHLHKPLNLCCLCLDQV